MPHVDDGTLHAYIDGAIDALADAGALPAGVTRVSIDAHFTLCADCRARLAAERDIHERAGLVLQDAAPAWSEPPSFESLRPAQRPRTWMPLTWAATVLLAVGAGWWGRDITRIAETTQAPYSAPVITAPAVESAVENAPPAVAQESAPAPAPAAGTSAATSATAERGESAREERMQPVQDAAAPVSAADAMAAPPPPAASASAAFDRRQLSEAAQRQLSAAAPAAPPPPASARVMLALTRGDDVPWEETGSAPEAMRLDGADVLQTGTRAEGGFMIVRVRQRIASGDTVDVVTVHQPVAEKALAGSAAAGAANAAGAARAMMTDELELVALDDGMRELQLMLPDGRVVALRARLDDATLRALAPSLVPAR